MFASSGQSYQQIRFEVVAITDRCSCPPADKEDFGVGIVDMSTIVCVVYVFLG